MKVQTLSVLTSSNKCNAACPYCISKQTPLLGVDNTIEVERLNLIQCCDLASRTGVTNVLITGKGETTLRPEDIFTYISIVSVYFPIIELQTNGLLLEKLSEDELIEWRKRGLNIISLSIVHYDSNEGKKIFTPHGEYIDLEEIIRLLHDLYFSVRLACIGIKGYIDNWEEIISLCDFAKKNKVEQLTWRPVKILDKSSKLRKYEVAGADFLKINEMVEDRGTRLLNLAHGDTIYDFEGQNLCIASCLTRSTAEDDQRQLIYFPDGHIRFDWELPGAILL